MDNHDVSSERAVLGGLLIDNEKIKDVRNLLNDTDFHDDVNRQIFRAVVKLDDRNVEVDTLTLHDQLKNDGLIDAVGGAAFLTELTNYVPTASHTMRYAKMVSDYSARRQISEVGKRIADSSSSGAPIEETLEKVKQQIEQVNNLGEKQNKYQVASMLDYVKESKERYANWNKMQGLSTGFPALDKLTLGMVGGELIIVAGPTSRGKTLLSMNIANNIAKYGGRVLFVTLEMTHAELTSRYMYANGGWDTDEFRVAAANTIFQQNDELDWQDIDGLMQNAKKELDVDLVIIDHLHYFTRELQNVAEDLGRITKEFKKNAKRYDIPVILISHIRKMQMGEELSGESLRGSSLIAQDADIVLLVNRDPETNQMGILIDKNRNRGKLSDRTKDWAGRDEREMNTIYLNFNNTRLQDPTDVPSEVKQIWPQAIKLPYKE